MKNIKALVFIIPYVKIIADTLNDISFLIMIVTKKSAIRIVIIRILDCPK